MAGHRSWEEIKGIIGGGDIQTTNPCLHHVWVYNHAKQQAECVSCKDAISMTEIRNYRKNEGGEVREVDPTTGGEKGSKLARFDLIPPEAMWALAEHYGKGAAKYEDRNYERGYRWGLSVAALQRHLYQWLQGESYDVETGTHNLIACAWHCFALFTFEIRGLGTNDCRRPPTSV